VLGEPGSASVVAVQRTPRCPSCRSAARSSVPHGTRGGYVMPVLWWIVCAFVWIVIAFWPARVAGRKGHSFIGYFIFKPVLLPGRAHRRLPRPTEGFGCPLACARCRAQTPLTGPARTTQPGRQAPGACSPSPVPWPLPGRPSPWTRRRPSDERPALCGWSTLLGRERGAMVTRDRRALPPTLPVARTTGGELNE